MTGGNYSGIQSSSGWARSCCPQQRSLVSSDGKMEREMDMQIGAATAVTRPLYWTVVVKRELSQNLKLPIFQPVSLPTLPYGYELWVERTRLQTQESGGWLPEPQRGWGSGGQDERSRPMWWREVRKTLLGSAKNVHQCEPKPPFPQRGHWTLTHWYQCASVAPQIYDLMLTYSTKQSETDVRTATTRLARGRG